MIKASVDVDEWYPVYSLTETDRDYDGVIEITHEEYEAIEAAFENFDRWQRFIAAKYGAGKMPQYSAYAKMLAEQLREQAVANIERLKQDGTSSKR